MVGDYREGGFSLRSSDDSDDASSVEEETTSSVYSEGKGSIGTEWTDEKHSLYLKSMEASFVDQLYNSLGAIGSNLNKEPEIGSSRKFCSYRKPSEEQFKVLRGGFWQKMNVKQPEYRLTGRHGGSGGGSHEYLRSPWIKHYKSLTKIQNPVKNEPDNQVSSGSASSLKQTLRDQISIQEEVSDQNFVNEVTKDENGSSKKMKTVTNTDQVVPIRKNACNMT